LKEEALDRTMWRARFERGFGPVVRQTTKWMNWVNCQNTSRNIQRATGSWILCTVLFGRDNIFGIAIRYELDGPELNPVETSFFRADSPKDHPASCKIDSEFFLAVKRPDHSADHANPSSAEVANGLVLYFHFPSVSITGIYWVDL
jgi:hypothetical protein